MLAALRLGFGRSVSRHFPWESVELRHAAQAAWRCCLERGEMRMRRVVSVVLVSIVTMLAAVALDAALAQEVQPPPAGWEHKSASTPLYTVKDGNQVDPKTLMGWKTWRAMACERCHGASQEGLVGDRRASCRERVCAIV